MYADPSLVRTKTMKLRVTADERAVLQAAADKMGMQLSTFCREVAIEQIRKEMELINMTPLS